MDGFHYFSKSQTYENGNSANFGEPPVHIVPDHRFSWADMPAVRFNDRFTGKKFEGEHLLVVRTEAKAGFLVPSHKHESEQITLIQTGAWRFTVAGREFEARAGEVVHIPAGWEHGAVALEDSVAVEIFTPPRREWSDTTDDYLWGV